MLVKENVQGEGRKYDEIRGGHWEHLLPVPGHPSEKSQMIKN